jgi:hypothetical protein
LFLYFIFSNQFRYTICRIPIYRYVDMNYSILNEKGKIKFILLLFEIITYSFLFYLNSCLGLRKTCDIMAQGLIGFIGYYYQQCITSFRKAP